LRIDGAAGEIRTPEVKHHWISNPAQWPGYATAAVNSATGEAVMNMTVATVHQTVVKTMDSG
tara:strand:+ start:551 stop:736 length:186 start_codon:yes stop_codon:yes gene_type:complete